jgi:hypothetical protein
MIPHKPNEIDEGLWGEQGWRRLLSGVGGWHGRKGKIRPLPGQGEQEPIVTAQDYPGFLSAPEHTTNASPLSAGGTLLSQDRGTRSLKCNIRRGLFGG